MKDFASQVDLRQPIAFRKLGIQSIAIGKVVGSLDRAHELDDRFRYRKRAITERYRRTMADIRRGTSVQPIKVLKLKRPRANSEYYVIDGHHRLAAMIGMDCLEINADVTEVRVDGAEG